MKPVGWRRESYRHYLAAKGIRTRYFATRTFLHGTNVKNIPSIMETGLEPRVPLWEEKKRRDLRRAIALEEKRIAQIGRRRDPSDEDVFEVIDRAQTLKREKEELQKTMIPRIFLTQSPEIAGRYVGESRFFTPEGKMIHRDDLKKYGVDVTGDKNVILRMNLDGSDVYTQAAFIGPDAYEIITEKPVPPSLIRVLSDKERLLLLGRKSERKDEEAEEGFRNIFMARKKVMKKGKLVSTRSGEEVRELANRLQREVKPYAVRADIAGSIRRQVEHPVDVDMVVIPKQGKEQKIREIIKRRATKIDEEGPKRLGTKMHGVDVDVYFTNRDEFGAQMMTRTGPFGANIYKRNLAKSKGWKLNEYGLFDKNGRRIANTEHGIYNKLGLSYRKPELRGTPR